MMDKKMEVWISVKDRLPEEDGFYLVWGSLRVANPFPFSIERKNLIRIITRILSEIVSHKRYYPIQYTHDIRTY